MDYIHVNEKEFKELPSLKNNGVYDITMRVLVKDCGDYEMTIGEDDDKEKSKAPMCKKLYTMTIGDFKEIMAPKTMEKKSLADTLKRK